MLFRGKKLIIGKKKSADKLSSIADYVRQYSYQQSRSHALKINCATRKANMFRSHLPDPFALKDLKQKIRKSL